MSHFAPPPLQAVTITHLGDEAALIGLTGAPPVRSPSSVAVLGSGGRRRVTCPDWPRGRHGSPGQRHQLSRHGTAACVGCDRARGRFPAAGEERRANANSGGRPGCAHPSRERRRNRRNANERAGGRPRERGASVRPVRVGADSGQFSASFFAVRGTLPLASPCPLSNFTSEIEPFRVTNSGDGDRAVATGECSPTLARP